MNIFKFTYDIKNLPHNYDANKAATGLERWLGNIKNNNELSIFCNDFVNSKKGPSLLNAIFGNSPYLSQSMLREHGFFKSICINGLDASFNKILVDINKLHSIKIDEASLMSSLRIAKRRAALLIAIADITKNWDLNKITTSLSHIADQTLEAAITYILKSMAKNGQIKLPCNDIKDSIYENGPYINHGFFIIGMGKLGSRELNYSSDIDLIILFDPQKIQATDQQEIRQACVRATRDLMRIMDSRTADGYVFRTDLRLRPDPSATSLAMTVTAAETYYESMGQNWERAAMIKARIVAGDQTLGQQFLDHIKPFIWRKHLDFAAIRDIHSIKRQINAHRGSAKVAINGHDIKIGRGGIREIEFFAQTQQLIWGGRDASLRVKPTCEALKALYDIGKITKQALNDLTASYQFLRRLEHHLQMVDDKQTQKMPDDDAIIDTIGSFIGYNDGPSFRDDLMKYLQLVEGYYADLFEDSHDENISGSLIFTGNEDNPDTIKNLQQMGFTDAVKVSNLIRIWHTGRYRATRSERSRQILTELMPSLLKALANSASPDEAFIKFDAFLEALPSGIQLFSLFQSYPAILQLLATIMGDAPRLAKWLAKSPILLDSVLTSEFNNICNNLPQMQEKLELSLQQANDFQDMLDIIRRWANDYKFKLGVDILHNKTTGSNIGKHISNMAEASINGIMPWVIKEFSHAHGMIDDSSIAVIAFGKLGGMELLPESDLDLVFTYDIGEKNISDGDKPLSPNLYYVRLCQRITTAISSQTGEGQLFEIDARLRPAGNAGALATQFESFKKYYDLANNGEAWTWEHMALTRARVVFAMPNLKKKLENLIYNALTQPRNQEIIVQDIANMRQRIAKQYPGKSPWDIKYHAGGLVDIEFICQYLQLINANQFPQILSTNTKQAFNNIYDAGLISQKMLDDIIESLTLWQNLQAMLRLTLSGKFNEDTAPIGLKQALSKAAGVSNFDILKTMMQESSSKSHEYFNQIITKPAEILIKKTS